MMDVAAEVLASLSTPDQVESRLGPLEFTDGAPARKTVETLYDHLDFVHGLNAFLTGIPGGLDAGDAPGVPRHRRRRTTRS